MNIKDFNCVKCNLTFQSIYNLRIHEEKEHAKNRISCQSCGEIFTPKNSFENHIMSCEQGFKKASNKECYYFKKGHCLKGETCSFKHVITQRSRVPECRNGSECKYLRNQICHFFHRGVGVQNTNLNYFKATNPARNTVWCKFNENCNRIQNCPFLHWNQDFPKLPNITKPPIWDQNNIQAWQDY